LNQQQINLFWKKVHYTVSHIIAST
jgi:hypothetical protein